MFETIITQKELDLRKSKGTIYICKSCYDFSKKITMINYDSQKNNGLIFGFCETCKKSLDSCGTCGLGGRL